MKLNISTDKELCEISFEFEKAEQEFIAENNISEKFETSYSRISDKKVLKGAEVLSVNQVNVLMANSKAVVEAVEELGLDISKLKIGEMRTTFSKNYNIVITTVTFPLSELHEDHA